MWGKVRILGWAAVVGCALFVIACDDDDDTAVKKPIVEVRLTDGPGDYDQVNIDIEDVQVNPSNDNDGWISLMNNNDKGVYDLLTLTNGEDVLLGSVALSATRLSQIRLILGTNNTIKIGDTSYDLITPSAQQSGLKLNLQQTLEEGVTYRILLDFDAAKSIVARGNNTYSLKPVLRVISEATSGSITGTVTPIISSPAIYAIQGEDTVNTTRPDDLGKFVLQALPVGTYKVTFEPGAGFVPKVIENVAVTLGTATPLGSITIEEEPPL